MAAPIIEVRNLTKYFGNVLAVDRVSFAIQEKEFLILLGPSGCGKSTILRMLAGLEIPSEGEIYFKGNCVFSSTQGLFVPARERNIGLVFQSYALWPHMTVFENIAFGLKVKRLPAQEIAGKVTNILSFMQLEGMRDRYPQQMSGGQQQRVALARMLVCEPDIFLMDEPLSNLDAKLRLEMRAEIKSIHSQSGATTVYVTHDQLEGQTMATDIAVINRGAIEQLADPKTIYNRPANLFVADFIGSPAINLIEGRTGRLKREGADAVTVENERLRLVTAYRALRPGLEVAAAIRPENIAFAAGEDVNTLTGEVRTVLPSGPETVIRVKHAGRIFNVLSAHEVNLPYGAPIHLYLPPQHILLFERETGNLLSPNT